MGFEGDVGGSASGAGFGDPSSGGWSGRGDVDAGTTGVDWGALAERALAALSLGLPGYAAPVGLGAQLALGKARGLTNAQLDAMAGRGITNFATGGLLGATQTLGQGAQWAAKALGAQGGPQPGMGAQVGSGGFGGAPPGLGAPATSRAFGLAPQGRGAAPGFAAQVFGGTMPPGMTGLAGMAPRRAGRAPGGMLPGQERGL